MAAEETHETIDGRFDLVRLAGEGGMGRVYEAVDRLTGGAVALKVLRDAAGQTSGRFSRESRLLAALRHPGVVRYVAHGTTASGEPYLAMEWLTGETLSARLKRAGLSVADGIALALAIARALGAVHRAGVVHRDLKPSNVFLIEGAPERPVLIDFGIARAPDAERRLTGAGVMIGTPGYMAPEQVRGELRVDARADVFSLGCVLFRCLTGRDAFPGGDSLSDTFKVLLDEPPRVCSLRPSVPLALDALVARMLAKERAARPPDADTVAAALEGLELRGLEGRRSVAPAAPSTVPPPLELTASERRLVCLLLVRDPGNDPSDPQHRALLAAVERHHGRLDPAAGGALPVIVAGAGAPTDLAARSARCAFALRDALGGAPVALCAGLVEDATRAARGDLLARARRLLEAAGERGASSSIHVDEVSAGLLGERFDVRQEGATLALHGEIEEIDAGRRLLGRPTVCLGREREIALLEALFAHSAEDSTANVALITGEAGVGKSRLRHELIRRLRARGQRFEAWVGHGDPMSTGSAFAVLARAVRNAAQIVESDPVEARREKIRRLASPLSEIAPLRPSAAFLAELVGTPLRDGDAREELGAARSDPLLMGDQMRRAAEDLIRTAAAQGPLILVLDDLQWGDLPTITFVDAALRNLADLPLLVLALARPEVTEIFPRLWSDRPMQVVRLPPLPRRAAEGLVKAALGSSAPADLVTALVERSGGNAFYLEELTRAVVSGEGAELPETVLAMAQARLGGLRPELRRVLRAASVFGRAFSAEGVEALLGGDSLGRTVAACLTELAAGELVVRRDEGPLAYGFGQALVREAAYGLLTAEDRALGHRLAGAWLLTAGKGDATALAEHFERGGEPARAVSFYRRAAEEALAGNDLAAALDRAARGAACGAAGEDLGALRLVEAEALVWRRDFPRAEACSVEAAALLEPGSPPWFRALEHGMNAATKVGATDRVVALAASAAAATPVAGGPSAQVRCLSWCALNLVLAGRYETADALLARVDGGDLAGAAQALDPHASAALHQARAFRVMVHGDLGAALLDFEASLAAFERAGDHRSICSVRQNLAYVLIELGGYADAERVLRAALTEAERLGLTELRASVLQNLGYALFHAGLLDEARGCEERSLEVLSRINNARMEGSSRMYLARVLLGAGDPDAAAREALAAVRTLAAAPPLRAAANAIHARALLRLGRAAEALAAAEEAHALLLASGGAIEEGEALVRLVYAEALAAAGRDTEAREALAAAKERLLARAGRISAPVWRERFLTQVADNAATLEAAGGG